MFDNCILCMYESEFSDISELYYRGRDIGGGKLRENITKHKEPEQGSLNDIIIEERCQELVVLFTRDVGSKCLLCLVIF